ncbi:RNA recognition motif domain-containing protein [Haliangium sp.]|uniref:RNA recognition motif domain-containing protein n=1 Tax=Haliangium sp. TaxID=2663208 RepID=UPI003D0F8E0C
MGSKLYVGNLAFSTSEETLRATFERDGRKVESVVIITDRDTGRSRGFAFIQMASESDAQAAIESLDGQGLDGRTLRVTEARERDANRRRGSAPPPRRRGPSASDGAGDSGPIGYDGPPARPPEPASADPWQELERSSRANGRGRARNNRDRRDLDQDRDRDGESGRRRGRSRDRKSNWKRDWEI